MKAASHGRRGEAILMAGVLRALAVLFDASPLFAKLSDRLPESGMTRLGSLRRGGAVFPRVFL